MPNIDDLIRKSLQEGYEQTQVPPEKSQELLEKLKENMPLKENGPQKKSVDDLIRDSLQEGFEQTSIDPEKSAQVFANIMAARSNEPSFDANDAFIGVSGLDDYFDTQSDMPLEGPIGGYDDAIGNDSRETIDFNDIGDIEV